MKPNKSYKALSVELETAKKVKKLKPSDKTLTEFVEFLLKLLDKK